jgi:alpha-glucosidase
LAMFVVYESPLVVLADHPEAYDNQPGIEFIEKVPTVWDDTKVLNGQPGEQVTIARSKDNAWYLGSMTNWDSREFEIPLDFLGKGLYDARCFADGPAAVTEGTSLSISVKQVKAGDKLAAHLAPGGGLAVIFTPVRR